MPPDHQDLLEDLRRLRQRVELARDARGSAPGSRARPRAWTSSGSASRSPRSPARRSSLRIAIVDAVPQADVVLQARAAQIQVAVAQPHVFATRALVGDRERRRLRLVQQPDLARRRPRPRRSELRVHACRRSRRRPCRVTPTTNSERSRLAPPSSRLVVGTTTCVMPCAIAHVEEQQPPRSRTRCTQPSSTTSRRRRRDAGRRRCGCGPGSRVVQPIDPVNYRLQAPDCGRCQRRAETTSLEPAAWSRTPSCRATPRRPVVRPTAARRSSGSSPSPRRAPLRRRPRRDERAPRVEAYLICLPSLSASG